MYDDEFAGQGGSFIIDPLTGKRVRAPEPQEPTVSEAQVEPVKADKKIKPIPSSDTTGA